MDHVDPAWGEDALPAGTLLNLCRGVLERGVSFRFRATGGSMSPFIRDGDVVTLEPVTGTLSGLGDVVAFVHPGSGILAVHRIVRRRDQARLLQGDAMQEPDGWVDATEILGRVVTVQRKGRRVRLGLGAERVGIALLRRYNAMWNLARALGRMARRLRWGAHE